MISWVKAIPMVNIEHFCVFRVSSRYQKELNNKKGIFCCRMGFHVASAEMCSLQREFIDGLINVGDNFKIVFDE